MSNTTTTTNTEDHRRTSLSSNAIEQQQTTSPALSSASVPTSVPICVSNAVVVAVAAAPDSVNNEHHNNTGGGGGGEGVVVRPELTLEEAVQSFAASLSRTGARALAFYFKNPMKMFRPAVIEVCFQALEDFFFKDFGSENYCFFHFFSGLIQRRL